MISMRSAIVRHRSLYGGYIGTNQSCMVFSVTEVLKVQVLIEDFSCAFEISGFEKSRISCFINFELHIPIRQLSLARSRRGQTFFFLPHAEWPSYRNVEAKRIIAINLRPRVIQASLSPPLRRPYSGESLRQIQIEQQLYGS